jgi:hypothetical protein
LTPDISLATKNGHFNLLTTQRWLKGRKSRFSGSEAALSVRAGEKQTRIRLLDHITSLAAT